VWPAWLTGHDLRIVEEEEKYQKIPEL